MILDPRNGRKAYRWRSSAVIRKRLPRLTISQFVSGALAVAICSLHYPSQAVDEE